MERSTLLKSILTIRREYQIASASRWICLKIKCFGFAKWDDSLRENSATLSWPNVFSRSFFFSFSRAGIRMKHQRNERLSIALSSLRIFQLLSFLPELPTRSIIFEFRFLDESRSYAGLAPATLRTIAPDLHCSRSRRSRWTDAVARVVWKIAYFVYAQRSRIWNSVWVYVVRISMHSSTLAVWCMTNRMSLIWKFFEIWPGHPPDVLPYAMKLMLD